MKRGMNNGTIVKTNNGLVVCKKSKKGRPKLELSKEILFSLENSDKPLSTSDLVHSLNRAWHTIDRACLKLQISGKVEGFRVGKMNLWRKA
jgi:hypothetical protein